MTKNTENIGLMIEIIFKLFLFVIICVIALHILEVVKDMADLVEITLESWKVIIAKMNNV